MDNEKKAFELWQQWMIEDSKLFSELIEENKKLNDYGK